MTKSVHFSLFHTWQVEKLDTVTGGPSVSPQLTHTMEISLRSHTRQVFLPSLSRTYGSSDWRRKSHQWTNQTDQWFPINSRVNRESNMNELMSPVLTKSQEQPDISQQSSLPPLAWMPHHGIFTVQLLARIRSGSRPFRLCTHFAHGRAPFRFLDFVLDLWQ